MVNDSCGRASPLSPIPLPLQASAPTPNAFHAVHNCTHLALVRGPLAIRIPVVHNLVTSRISHLGSGVTESSVSRPRELVASRLGDEEGLGASLVTVVVDAFLDVVVEDRAVGNLLSYQCQQLFKPYGQLINRGK